MSYYHQQEMNDLEYEIKEEIFEHNYNTCIETLENIKRDTKNTTNPFLLMNCNPGDLFNFIESGKCQLERKQKSFCLDTIEFIPEPINMKEYEEWKKTTNPFIVCGEVLNEEKLETIKEKELEERKQKLEEFKKIEEEKRISTNKHNWTIPKPKKPTPPSQPKKRKTRNQRKKLYKYRAKKIVTQETEYPKPSTGKYQPKRVAIKYE